MRSGAGPNAAWNLPAFVPPTRPQAALPRPPIRAEAGRVALVVLGVGRSGTSALARMLSLLGGALPKDVLGPGRGNERGHWEPAVLVALGDAILRWHGREWRDPSPLPPAWFASDEAEYCIGQIAGVIEHQYDDAPLIVIKEPRLCRLSPLMFAALERLHIEPRIVLPVRHPSEVVRSICLRDDADPLACELLWVRDLLQAEAASRRFARVWTGFDDLLADWRGVADAISSRLALSWPNPPERAAAGIEKFLEPGLRHFDIGANTAPASVGALACRLWQATCHGVRGDEAALRAEFDLIHMVDGELNRLACRDH
jgi:hypothetical protein